MDKEEQIEQLQTMLEDMREEKTLLSWEAPERSFKRRNKDFWITAMAILILVAVILLFVKEFFLIVALGSALFLYYVLSAVPPGKVTNKITNRGVYFGELFYPWADLARFWFKKSADQNAVFLETKLRFPREISLVIDDRLTIKIKENLIKYLPLVETSPRFVDKTATWLSKKLPLEDRVEK